MRDHHMVDFRVHRQFRWRIRHREILDRRRRLQLQRELLFELANRREVFVETRAIRSTDLLNQARAIILDCRQTATANHRARIDGTSVVKGRDWSVRIYLGGTRMNHKKKKI